MTGREGAPGGANTPKPKQSGAARRKVLKEREKAAAKAHARTLGLDFVDPANPVDTSAHDAAVKAEAQFIQNVEDLGPTPNDPVEAIVYATQMTAIVMRSAAVDAYSVSLDRRRKAILDAVRAIGMTNSKAVDKSRLLRIEQRLGLAEKDKANGLEECADGDEALRA